MKRFILVALLGLGFMPALHAQAATELDKLKQQFDTDSAAALKPVVLRYAAQLEAARRAALQRGDARAAVAAEDALNDLRSKTTVAIPASAPIAGAATAGATPAPPTLDELRKRMGGTKWRGDDGGLAAFGADNSVTTSWGTRGEWKIVNPHRMTVDWGKNKKEETVLDPDLKTFTRPSGIKWHLQ